MNTKDWLSVVAILLLIAVAVLDAFGFKNIALGCAAVLGMLVGHLMTVKEKK